jgi:hypothetical protein
MRKRIDDALADVRNDLELIKTISMIREPAAVQAAEAYDGLRKAVIAGTAERNAHLQQLARLDAEVNRGADIEAIQRLLRDLLAEAGLHRLNEVQAGAETAFDNVGGKGEKWRVLEPAYFEDTGRGDPRLVRMGKAERFETASSDLLPAVPATAETGFSAVHEQFDDDALVADVAEARP